MRNFSRRSWKLKGAQPRFNVGDVAGEFKVVEYIGLSTVHPRKATKLSKEHHWYKCQCSCGIFEVHTQQQLVDTRRSRMCSICQANKLNRERSENRS